MRKLAVDVVVIGGGSTGAGVVRDVAMRGYSTVLLDRADLGQGTTGRFHGLLHSGGRYVVSDPLSATECAAGERDPDAASRPTAIETTGGYFVTAPATTPTFADKFLAGAAATGVPAHEITVGRGPAQRAAAQPAASSAPSRCRTAPSTAGSWSGARPTRPRHYGAQILTYHQVTEIDTADGDRSRAVHCHRPEDRRGRASSTAPSC